MHFEILLFTGLLLCVFIYWCSLANWFPLILLLWTLILLWGPEFILKQSRLWRVVVCGRSKTSCQPMEMFQGLLGEWRWSMGPYPGRQASDWGVQITTGTNFVYQLNMASVSIIDRNSCKKDNVYGKDKISVGMFCARLLRVFSFFQCLILFYLPISWGADPLAKVIMGGQHSAT